MAGFASLRCQDPDDPVFCQRGNSIHQPIHQIAVTVAPPQQHDVDNLVGILVKEFAAAGLLDVDPQVIVRVLIPAQLLDDLILVDAQPLREAAPAVTRGDHRRDLLHLSTGCLGPYRRMPSISTSRRKGLTPPT